MKVTGDTLTEGAAASARGDCISAAHAEAVAAAAGGSMAGLLATEVKVDEAAGKCTWRLGVFVGETAEVRAALAWILAEAILQNRGGASDVVTIWRTAALSGTKLVGREKRLVEAFTADVFGLPPEGQSLVHLVGHVAEWLWYLHARSNPRSERSILLLDAPKFNVTEPGADGFVVFSDGNSAPCFQLWVVKQHVGASSLSNTVGTAYDQLSQSATRYLAQLTSYYSSQSGEVGELCKRLVDLWVDEDERAGVGVGVASSTAPAPRRCFSTMGQRFPGLSRPGQLEGLLLIIEDLEPLAVQVREYLWTVL